MVVRLTEEQARLVHDNVNLAHAAAKVWWDRNFQNQWSSKNSDDTDLREVTAVAYQGLVTAAQNWDPHRHPVVDERYDARLAFAGFAKKRIVGTILDWQRKRDHVPRRQRRIYKELQRQGHGTGVSLDQLADITGLDVDKIRAITQAVESTDISLDLPPEGWADFPSYSDVPVSGDVEGTAIVSTVQQVLVETIDGLPDLQHSIIVLRYYAGFEFPRIAAQLGVRLSAVRSAHNEAMYLIHDVMRRAVS